jgi:type IV fimbrial biogenesis protein FimT
MNCDHRTMRNVSRDRGFTLVELMVTVFIAALLFGIAIPSFRSIMANNRLVTQTNEMVGALQIARSEAITRNTTVMFCRTAAAADTACAGGTATSSWLFWIVRYGAGANPVIRSAAIPTYGGGMKITSNFSNNTVVFSSDGLARNGTATGALLTATELLTVCSSTITTENRRVIMPGSGSRLSTTKATGTC